MAWTTCSPPAFTASRKTCGSGNTPGRHGCRISTGGFTFQNAALGALYSEDELLEYHQPLNEVLVPYFSLVSEMKDGRFYLPDVPGLPVHLDFERLERDGLLRGIQFYYHK